MLCLASTHVNTGCSSSRHDSWPRAVHVLPMFQWQPLMRLAHIAVPFLIAMSEGSCQQAAAHAGCTNSPRHNSWPGAVHVLPTSLLQPLMRLAQSFVMARPDMPDCPIVYASQRFLDLTGYPR